MLEQDDARGIVRYADNEENWRYTLFDLYPYYEEYARDFIDRAQKGYESGIQIILGIELIDQEELIGAVDLRIIDRENKCAEIGYMISYPYWGKGYATEAIRLLTGYAFDTMMLHRLQAVIFEVNARSSRVLEKCGFVREGVERQRYFRNGVWHTGIVFSIIESEYCAREP